MAWTILDAEVGAQPITVTDTVQRHQLGRKVVAYDSTYGRGEFVYQKGVASTAVGDLCILNAYAGSTTRAVAGSRGMVGAAMSANVASQYGWYQVWGAAVLNSDTTASGVALFIDGTTGRVDDAVVSGDKVDGAISLTADGTPSANKLIAMLVYPNCCGNG